MVNVKISAEKAVIWSVRRPHTDKIISRYKVSEIRTRIPKDMSPNTIHYIYESKARSGSGKVIGEFRCMLPQKWTHKQISIPPRRLDGTSVAGMFQRACLTQNELLHYSKGKDIYEILFSDLIIYALPKDLSEFHIIDEDAVSSCPHREQAYTDLDHALLPGAYTCNKEAEFVWCTKCKTRPIGKPPQSFCFVIPLGSTKREISTYVNML